MEELFLILIFRHDPTSKLAELFNINHFIVSQANIFTLPFVFKPTANGVDTIYSRIINFFYLEARHRIIQVINNI